MNLNLTQFSAPRPPPPLTLLYRKIRIASLGDSATERIEHARVLARLRFRAEPVIQGVRIRRGQRFHGPDSKPVEIRFNRRAYTRQTAKLPFDSRLHDE
jgi:hypothetical protein